MSSEAWYRASNIYSYITLLLFSILGSICIHVSHQIEDKTVSTSPIQQQVIPDWQTQPFVDIGRYSADVGCPDGWAPLFSRLWSGMDLACDCLDSCDPYSANTTCHNMNLGVQCNATQIQAGCSNVDPWPAIYQSIMGNDIFCGKYGGNPFVNVTRANLNNVCPNGTVSCLADPTAGNNLCYPESDLASSCGITELFIVPAADIYPYQQSIDYSILQLNTTAYIVYSKSADSLPITSIRVEVQPCINPLEESISPDQTFYGAEMLREGCQKNSFLNITYDPRYVESGVYTTVYDVQNDNGVQDILVNSPNFSYYVSDPTVYQDFKISSWNRPTINWSLQCEAEGNTREDGLQAIATPSVSSQIDTEIFRRLGITILSLYLPWFGICLVVHIFALKKKDTKKTAELLVYIMYVPSRVAFAIWGPWLASTTSINMSDLKYNQALVNNMAVVNECMDEYQQINIAPVQAELNEGIDDLHGLWVMLWICFALMAVEGIFWLIFMCASCINKAERHQMERNFSQNNQKGGQITVVNASQLGNGQYAPLQQQPAPLIQYPVQQVSQQPQMVMMTGPGDQAQMQFVNQNQMQMQMQNQSQMMALQNQSQMQNQSYMQVQQQQQNQSQMIPMQNQSQMVMQNQQAMNQSQMASQNVSQNVSQNQSLLATEQTVTGQ